MACKEKRFGGLGLLLALLATAWAADIPADPKYDALRKEREYGGETLPCRAIIGARAIRPASEGKTVMPNLGAGLLGLGCALWRQARRS